MFAFISERQPIPADSGRQVAHGGDFRPQRFERRHRFAALLASRHVPAHPPFRHEIRGRPGVERQIRLTRDVSSSLSPFQIAPELRARIRNMGPNRRLRTIEPFGDFLSRQPFDVSQHQRRTFARAQQPQARLRDIPDARPAALTVPESRSISRAPHRARSASRGHAAAENRAPYWLRFATANALPFISSLSCSWRWRALMNVSWVRSCASAALPTMR